MDYSWRIGGEAGYGIETAGLLFAKLCLKHGLNVFGSREYPSLIRGGHNTFTIRFSDKELTSQSKHCDFIAALNDRTITEELNDLRKDGVIIHDNEIKLEVNGFKLISAPLKEIATKHGDPKIMMNMVIIGVSAGLIGFNKTKCVSVIKEFFKSKPKFIEANINGFSEGYDHGIKNNLIKVTSKKPLNKMLVDGNTAFAIGAIRAGCNFITSYPMTPATSIFEYLCGKAKEYGVRAVQTEDETSALNTALGASFAGARALTCTSGGGFALMTEAVSLAGMSETPIVIALSQRPGPATGMPTRTEQADLLFAINAGHGEFSKIVLAPGDANECYSMALDAFNYAEKYQTPVIVMLDKHLSVSINSVKQFTDKYVINRGKVSSSGLIKEGHRFNRYSITKDGISPRPLIGSKLISCYNGEEHDEEGFINESSDNRIKMSDKRLRKHQLIIKDLSKGISVHGDGALTLIGWGSTKGALLEASKVLGARFIQVKILSPLPADAIKKNLKGRVILVENNRDGQLSKLLKEAGINFNLINKFDGRPIHPEEIISEVNKLK